ncbi:MAG: SH3 domain-containing protein [Anaerolineae bacterium]
MITRWLIAIGLALMIGALVNAQGTCSLDDALERVIADCDEQASGTLCHAGGDSTLISASNDAPDWQGIGANAPLQDLIAIELESANTTSAVRARLMIAVEWIAYGTLTIHNSAPRQIVTVYALRNVNLREQPSVDARVIGSFVRGQNYQAVARLADNTWLQLQLEDGRIGWASAQYFRAQTSFTELEIVTPTDPPYLPMQAVRLSENDCGGLVLVSAPQTNADDDTLAPIVSINGVQITLAGVLWAQVQDDQLSLQSLQGEHSVNTFGFETVLTMEEALTIPLNADGALVGVASPADLPALTVAEALLAQLATLPEADDDQP